MPAPRMFSTLISREISPMKNCLLLAYWHPNSSESNVPVSPLTQPYMTSAVWWEVSKCRESFQKSDNYNISEEFCKRLKLSWTHPLNFGTFLYLAKNTILAKRGLTMKHHPIHIPTPPKKNVFHLQCLKDGQPQVNFLLFQNGLDPL